jgi:class 3 adenylate cyclase
MVCPYCQANNPQEATFCINCGRVLQPKCTNCQAELAPGALYCMHCGQPVQPKTAMDDQRMSRLTAVVPDKLLEKIRSDAKTDRSRQPGGLKERRVVTMLLVDVVGSRALRAQLQLDTWTELLNGAFDRIAQIIYSYEGTIARILGDSLLAFFGAPIAHEDDPQRAVWAGIEIISQIKRYCQDVKDTQGIDFNMRVCINTGPLIVGPVGEDLTYDFSARTGTINLISRIKFAGKPMSILITANTHRFVSAYFDCTDAGLIKVNGMSKRVRLYQVSGARQVVGRTRGFAELGSPMVGRQRELASLMLACEAVRAGLGRAVVISGEPGLGKTRLIQEWQKEVDRQENGFSPHSGSGPTDRNWLLGRCVSYKQGVAYQLVIDLVKNMIGVSLGSDEPETRIALQGYLHKTVRDEAAEIYPFLGSLLGVKLEGADLRRTEVADPQALQTNYVDAVQKLLGAIINRGPTILILEDLHWADAASVELLIKLLPLVSTGPILFCMVTRVERDSVGWKLVNAARELLGGRLTDVSLQNLSEKDSRSLVANLLTIESLSGPVKELILEKAEGNPLFMEEVIRMLIDRGAIEYQGNKWVAKQEVSARDIPDNLQGLLQTRIDRLPAEARQTLLVASVIGRSFPVKVLSWVMGGD